MAMIKTAIARTIDNPSTRPRLHFFRRTTTPLSVTAPTATRKHLKLCRRLKGTATATPIQRPLQVLELDASESSFDCRGDSNGETSTETSQSLQRATLYEATDTGTASSPSTWKIRPYPYDETPDKRTPAETVAPHTTSASLSLSSIQEHFHHHVLQHFLPAQYPHSVSSGYARFTAFSFCASLAGSAGMVLSTQTLLLAVGVVGSTGHEASIMAGALNWVLKDGIGQAGGVLFASFMGRMQQFDSNPKRWRMVAAVALDTANFMEIVAPCVTATAVLPIACCSNVLKNIGFLTASASRAALHQSLAAAGNLADVTAKAGSQSMAAGLLGTCAGIGLSTALGHDAQSFMAAFCVLSVVHQGCNYVALQAVPLSHLNRHRLYLLVSEYVKSGETRTVVSPRWVADKEVFFPLVHADDAHTWLSIGSPLSDACPNGPDELALLLPNNNDSTTAGNLQAHIVNQTADGRIHLVFLRGATGEDLIRGMLAAFLLREKRLMSDSPVVRTATPTTMTTTTTTVSCITDDVTASGCEASQQFPLLLKQLHEKGWTTETNVTSIEPSNARRLQVQQQR